MAVMLVATTADQMAVMLVARKVPKMVLSLVDMTAVLLASQ